LLEWAIYLAEREILSRNRAAEGEAESVLLAYGDGYTPTSALSFSHLILKVDSRNHQVRREAAKALGEIDDPESAKTLVKLLLDEDHSVRWTAMGSLTKLRRTAVKPLMEALTQHFQSARLREGAHHVLRTLHNYGILTKRELEVYHALEGAAPGIQAAWAANNALISYQVSPGD
jgi:HEAT repeat protein